MIDSGEPPTKKRKLPSLDDSFSGNPRSNESPALHQGRKRTQPHVEGQWAAHVYLDLELDPILRRTIRNALETVRALPSLEKEVYSLFEHGTTGQDAPDNKTSSLHVSLTRPLYLQTNQKVELNMAVAKVAASFEGFLARYASFGMLENDEKSRRFLAIEIGQGYQELKDLTRRLDLELEKLRLPPYYENPRFHTSIAWSSNSKDDGLETNPFQPDQLEELDKKYGRKLRQEELWVGELVLKIGKDIKRYKLSGV